MVSHRQECGCVRWGPRDCRPYPLSTPPRSTVWSRHGRDMRTKASLSFQPSQARPVEMNSSDSTFSILLQVKIRFQFYGHWWKHGYMVLFLNIKCLHVCTYTSMQEKILYEYNLTCKTNVTERFVLMGFTKQFLHAVAVTACKQLRRV